MILNHIGVYQFVYIKDAAKYYQGSPTPFYFPHIFSLKFLGLNKTQTNPFTVRKTQEDLNLSQDVSNNTGAFVRLKYPVIVFMTLLRSDAHR